VDDDRIAREFMVSACKMLGVNYVATPSVNEAITLMRSRTFDLVVLDHELNGVTGLSMLAYLGGRVPAATDIIVCSSRVEAAEMRAYERLSVREVLRKPVTLDQLAFAMRKTLSI